eukprot:s4_g76.t1
MLKQEVKPAGTETDEKAVAALIALTVTADNNFYGIGNLETSCLLQRGLLYRRKRDNSFVLSLGFVQYAALGWQLEAIEYENEFYFCFPSGDNKSFDQKTDCLHFLTCSAVSNCDDDDDKEEFAGVPFEVCIPVHFELLFDMLCPSVSLPSELRFHGALLKQKGAEERLLRHMLLSERMLSITEQRLRILLLTIKASIIKFAEKTVTKKSLVWSLIMAVLPDVEQSQKLDLLLSIIGAKQKPDMVPDEITHQAFKTMGDEEVKNQFEGLKNRIDRRIIDKRFQQSATRAVGDRKARLENPDDDAPAPPKRRRRGSAETEPAPEAPSPVTPAAPSSAAIDDAADSNDSLSSDKDFDLGGRLADSGPSGRGPLESDPMASVVIGDDDLLDLEEDLPSGSACPTSLVPNGATGGYPLTMEEAAAPAAPAPSAQDSSAVVSSAVEEERDWHLGVDGLTHCGLALQLWSLSARGVWRPVAMVFGGCFGQRQKPRPGFRVALTREGESDLYGCWARRRQETFGGFVATFCPNGPKDQGLVIRDITQDARHDDMCTAASRWNAGRVDRQIRAGQVILEVNGQTETPEMLREVHDANTLDMLISDQLTPLQQEILRVSRKKSRIMAKMDSILQDVQPEGEACSICFDDMET